MAMYLDVQAPTKIVGESQAKHPDWNQKIEIQHMSYDITQRTSMEAGTGLVSSGSQVGHLNITKVMDVSTPHLWYHLCCGTPIDLMYIRVSRAGAAGHGLFEAETYKIENVIVSSYQTSGSAGSGGLPVESWSFSFTKIEETYQEVDQKGARLAPKHAGHDFAQGFAI